MLNLSMHQVTKVTDFINQAQEMGLEINSEDISLLINLTATCREVLIKETKVSFNLRSTEQQLELLSQLEAEIASRKEALAQERRVSYQRWWEELFSRAEKARLDLANSLLQKAEAQLKAEQKAAEEAAKAKSRAFFQARASARAKEEANKAKKKELLLSLVD